MKAVLADVVAETVAAKVAADLLGMLLTKRSLNLDLGHFSELLIVKEVGVAILLHHHR